jgi:small-conductance mechanosensitive channel
MDDGFEITKSLQNGLDRVFEQLPQILGVIILLVVGWLFASIARSLTKKLLHKVNFDTHIKESPVGSAVMRVIEQPAKFVSKFVYWVVLLAFILFAVSSLNVPALNLMINGVYRYLPNVLAALIIFLVASAITAGAEVIVQKVFRNSPLSKILAAIIPAITMSIATFMILNQLKIAEDIVNITYTALMGSIALGLALAFGLGGRDVAGRILEQAYSNMQQNSDMIKSETSKAAANTRQQARRVRGRTNPS